MRIEILEDTDAFQLEKIVNRYLSEGWELHGVLWVHVNPTFKDRMKYTQAVIKK